MFYVSYFMKCKTGNHFAAIMTWQTIYPMDFIPLIKEMPAIT